jgi:asparagine synthase (glutamine-hydrolysing)
MFYRTQLLSDYGKAVFVNVTIAALSKNGCDVVPAVVRVLQSLKLDDCQLVLASPSEVHEAENLHDLAERCPCSPVALVCVLHSRLKHLAPNFERTAKSFSVFEGRLYSNPFTASLDHLCHDQSLPHEARTEKMLRESEGDFSLVTVEPKRILATRDSVGVQPLYYGENNELATLASNKKALWKLGINESCSFPPGNIASVTNKGFLFRPVRTLTYQEPRETTLEEAAQTLRKLLEESVKLRVREVKKVAVAFSGGLDSSVIAFLTKECGVKVHLLHVSLAGQNETEDAKRAAEELNLPLSMHLFHSADVEKTVSKVVGLIEEPDPVKAAIGIPFYWVAEKTAAAGLDVLLAGQGADELFGGYQRYVNEYVTHGEDCVRRILFHDVVRLPESNLERDEKICGFHGVDLRLPFASFGIAEFALSLPIDLKVEKKMDGQRKIVLRRLASNLGLSEAIVNKPKKAVQYATGVNAVLGKIAKKHGLTVGAYVEMLFREEREINR